jgi:hypothetical protein
MKWFNLFFSIVFVLFAALQYNDPDPYLWIPIYFYPAVLCWLAFRNRFYMAALWLGIAIFGGYAIYLFFVEDGVLDWIQKHNEENIAGSMQATKPWIEYTREFFGLAIIIIVLVIDLIYASRRKQG